MPHALTQNRDEIGGGGGVNLQLRTAYSFMPLGQPNTNTRSAAMASSFTGEPHCGSIGSFDQPLGAGFFGHGTWLTFGLRQSMVASPVDFPLHRIGTLIWSSLALILSSRQAGAICCRGQEEAGAADVEKADLIAKDIGDHQLADEDRGQKTHRVEGKMMFFASKPQEMLSTLGVPLKTG